MKKHVTLTGVLMISMAIALTSGTTLAESATAKEFKGVELHVLMMAHEQSFKAAQDGCKEFQKITGAKVVLEAAPYAALHEKAMVAFIAHTGAYDVISVPYQWTGEFVEGGFIIPLTESIKKDNPEIEGFIPKALELYGSWKGQVYELPWNGEACTYWYRKDLFEEAGVSPPETWDEFMELAKLFTRDTTGDGKIDFWGTAMMGNRPQAMTMWTNRFWGMGGKLLDENMKPVMHTTYRDIGIKSLKILKQAITDYSPPGSLGWGLPEASELFLDGKAAQVEMWPLSVGFASEDPSQSKVVGKVGASLMPGGVPHSGGWGLAVADDSKNKEAAYQLVKFLTNTKNDQFYFLKYGKLPTRTAAYEDPAISAKFYFFQALKESIAHAKPRFRLPESAELCDIMDLKVSEFTAGQITAEQCLDHIAKGVEGVLEREGYYK